MEQKTQARHAIELIADYHESHGDDSGAYTARQTPDHGLLIVIRDVLVRLTTTRQMYLDEKGREEQATEIARLKEELEFAKGPQTDLLARANERIGALQELFDIAGVSKARLEIVINSMLWKPAIAPDSTEFWSKLVYPGGMTAEQVKAELDDFHFMMKQVPRVYMAVTGDRLSKPNYYAETVISEFEGFLQDRIAEAVEEEKEIWEANHS